MATASLQIGDTAFVYTFMGLDSTKACSSGMRLESFRYNTVSGEWKQIADVPDTEGRIAASATGVNGKVYVIGGYKVYANCNEFSSPRVDIYDPQTDSWTLGDSTPTPIDDHVQLLYKDSLIIVISGWTQNQNTRKVQIYDTYLDVWSDANNIIGSGKFGHSGGIWGDTIIYIDGVSSSFSHNNQTYRGVIQNGDPHSIAWTNLGTHAGRKTYRAGGFSYSNRILFTGGTNNAYNFDGIGYNGQPSVETGRTWGYNLNSGLFEEYASNPDSVMDVREIVQVGGNEFYSVGGMEANQTVSNRVSVFIIDSVFVGVEEGVENGLGFEVFPTVIESSLEIRKQDLDPGICNLQFHDALGRLFYSKDVEHAGGEFRLEMNFNPSELPMGQIFLKIATANSSQTIQLVHLK